jgi:hypothetical protein
VHLFISLVQLLGVDIVVLGASCMVGRGMRILYKDVKSCQDEDVHVLWSILVDSHRHPAMVKLKL